MNRKEIVISLLSGMLLFLIATVRTPQFSAEATFFVPLTLLEKQIEQNGIGFGSPTEVDAHIELMQSPVVLKEVQQKFTEAFSLSVSKTRNGAVAVEVRSADAPRSAAIANYVVEVADSIKQAMLRQNVGMSFDVVEKRTLTLQSEEVALRKELDGPTPPRQLARHPIHRPDASLQIIEHFSRHHRCHARRFLVSNQAFLDANHEPIIRRRVTTLINVVVFSISAPVSRRRRRRRVILKRVVINRREVPRRRSNAHVGRRSVEWRLARGTDGGCTIVRRMYG